MRNGIFGKYTYNYAREFIEAGESYDDHLSTIKPETPVVAEPKKLLAEKQNIFRVRSNQRLKAWKTTRDLLMCLYRKSEGTGGIKIHVHRR